MNTISILQDEAHNMPEGLYLRLMDALKKDFHIKEESDDDIHYETRVKLMFYGYMDGMTYVDFRINAEKGLKYLKEHTDNRELIKNLFNNYFDADQCYYDMNEDEIIYTYEGSIDEGSDEEESDDEDESMTELRHIITSDQYALDLYYNNRKFCCLYVFFTKYKEEEWENGLYYWIFDQ